MIMILFGILLIGSGAYMFKKNNKTALIIVAGVVVACLGFADIAKGLNQLKTTNQSAYRVYADYIE